MDEQEKIEFLLKQRDLHHDINTMRRDMDLMAIRINTLTEAINNQQESISGLLLAWESARGLPSFVKWVAGIVAAGSILWGYVRDLIQ